VEEEENGGRGDEVREGEDGEGKGDKQVTSSFEFSRFTTVLLRWSVSYLTLEFKKRSKF